MTNQHPITPPPELVEQWFTDQRGLSEESRQQIATRAAQWGADQELEACCADILEILAGIFADRVIDDWEHFVELLREGRRPSLKEQALDALDRVVGVELDLDSYAVIRSALLEEGR